MAKTGDEPAVTKSQQLIKLDDDIMLYDTPGMLWPKVENENSGYRLAATGGIRDTAFDFADVASYTAEYLMHAYPELLKTRYKIDELPKTDWEFFEVAGRNRGCVRSGNRSTPTACLRFSSTSCVAPRLGVSRLRHPL